MKKDIPENKVKGVYVAAIKPTAIDSEPWEIHIVNDNEHPIEMVLINSKGFGEVDGEQKETSTLRHMIEHIEAKSSALIEPITPDLFHLTNRYWITYYIGRAIYDKKFLFLPHTISESHFTTVPVLDQQGVMHA